MVKIYNAFNYLNKLENLFIFKIFKFPKQFDTIQYEEKLKNKYGL